jgi:HEAT repeat protein
LYALARPDAASQAAAVAAAIRDDGVSPLRERALRTLARMGARDPAYAAAAASSLSDPDALVRRAALETVEILGAARHSGAVAERLQDSETSVRVQAAQLLGSLGIREHRDALTASAIRGPTAARWAALLALARLGEAPAEIGPALGESEPAIRAAAAACFIRAGSPQGRLALLEVLQSPPHGELTEPALRMAISFLEAGSLAAAPLEPGTRTLEEWLQALGIGEELDPDQEPALTTLLTLHQGAGGQLLAAAALRVRAAFIEKEGRILLVSQDAAVHHIASER